MNILITGGAGYIGSHVVKQLLESKNYNLTIIDNLSNGNLKTIKILEKIRDFTFFNIDLKEFDKIDSIIEDNNIDTILHFAASIEVSESVQNPLKYYLNNTVNTTNLIDSAIKNGVEKFIFSSTAAVYGEPKSIPSSGIDESFETNPINAYGMSKLMSEKILQDTQKKNENFKFVIFRYFNVAGSDINYYDNTLSPRIGESHKTETHLIPLVLQTALKKREEFSIFGNDFKTKDGTCIRDYIHVEDLADAHIKAISYLDTNESNIFNVGYSRGFSVKEVVNTIKTITNINFKVNTVERRDGDPAILVSNNQKIIEKMNWKPKYDSLEFICKSAFEWEKIR